MKWYLCAMVAILVPLVHSQTKEIPYPTFRQCDQKIISSINHYWKTAGKPKNVLQKMENDGLYKIIRHSYKFRTGAVKCLDAEFKNGAFTLYIIRTNGAPPLNITYTLETGEDEVIRARLTENDAPKFRWNWYTIYSDKGIAASYVCGEVEGIDKAPLGNILLRKNYTNMFNSTKVKHLNSMLEEWGFKLDVTYGEQCF